MAPTINNDTRFLQYRNTETEFDYKTISFAPDQFLVDKFKYLESCEVFSDDPRSNQVVLRCGYKIDWISKPFGIWQIIENSVRTRV